MKTYCVITSILLILSLIGLGGLYLRCDGLQEEIDLFVNTNDSNIQVLQEEITDLKKINPVNKIYNKTYLVVPPLDFPDPKSDTPKLPEQPDSFKNWNNAMVK